MAEVGEEMCQAEVAHHANNGPEYLCSRPEKHVYFYKKALAIDTERAHRKRKEDDEAAESSSEEWEADDEGAAGTRAARRQKKRKLWTKPSDLELYERRAGYCFEEGTSPSEDVPYQDSPEEQVAEMSAYDFFRLVKLRGGKRPSLEWHPKESRPIVTISPSIKLREGADFAFGARWALMQYHPWLDRREFLGMSDADVKARFRAWIEEPGCPWYIRQQYLAENARHGSTTKDPVRKPRGGGEEPQQEGDGDDARGANGDGEWDDGSQIAESSDEGTAETKLPDDIRVLKLLYQGNMAEVSRQEEQSRKAKVFSRKHDFYRHTRCTSVAQEEQSALPAGVINVNEDSEDDDDYEGEQKEIAKEMDELRVAQRWVNQSGRDAAVEGRAMSASTGTEIDLRLDWGEVKRTLQQGAGSDGSAVLPQLDEASVRRDYDLDALDPTQRAFADRVLRWVAEVVRVYKEVRDTGVQQDVPLLRSWLGGSAGSGKSTTLRTIVQHARLAFQQEQVDATIQLTAYTGRVSLREVLRSRGVGVLGVLPGLSR